DEIVVPNTNEEGSSSVHTGGGEIANIAVQEVCPGHKAEHLAMGSYDPVGYALALDALTHAGPAQKSRIALTVCAQALQPGAERGDGRGECELASVGRADAHERRDYVSCGSLLCGVALVGGRGVALDLSEQRRELRVARERDLASQPADEVRAHLAEVEDHAS